MNFYIYGGNEQSTHKFVNEMLGKETIDTNTYGKSTGNSASYSTNYQVTGRDLLTPDEVRMLENEKSILLIRGEKPIIDYKFDILKHSNLKYTVDGGGKIYEHGEIGKPKIALEKLDNVVINEKDFMKIEELTNVNYELLSEEDIEEYYNMEDIRNENKK